MSEHRRAAGERSSSRLSPRLVGGLVGVVGLAGILAAVLVEFPAEDRTKVAEPGPVRAVQIDVEVGTVAVTAGEGDGATVDRTRRYLRGRPSSIERLVDGVLTVSANCGRPVRLGCHVEYRITVPAAASVRVRTGRASVSVAGVAGMVDVTTGAGGVDLRGTRGPVRVTTSAGAVAGTDLAADFLDATTGAGAIRLTMAEPPGRVGLHTGAGGIDLALPSVPDGYRVDAKAGAGKVDVNVPSNPSGNRAVVVTSGAGRVRIHPR